MLMTCFGVNSPYPCMLQARAGPPDCRAKGSSCQTRSAENYPGKRHLRVILCSLPTTGCWGFPALSSTSLVSSLFFHVEVIHFVSCAAEGFRWGNESARSARADKHTACLLSVMHSALSTGMYSFFLTNEESVGGPNVTTVPCSFVGDLFITLHALLAICGVAASHLKTCVRS